VPEDYSSEDESCESERPVTPEPSPYPPYEDYGILDTSVSPSIVRIKVGSQIDALYPHYK
jgi:hypothetical protein